MDFHTLKRQMLMDPEFAAEYNAAQPAFELASSIIGLRLAKGWSQKQLAHRAGTKQPAISRLENMDAKPSLSTLQRIAAALDADVVVRLEPKKKLPKARAAKKQATARRHVKRVAAARAR